MKKKPKDDPRFDKFWSLYPPRWNQRRCKWVRNDKAGARKEWDKLKQQEKFDATVAAAKVEKSKFTPDARKWLKYKRWTDEEIDGSPPEGSENNKKTISEMRNEQL